jgi:peptide/nickel transport system permease protein
MAVSTTAYRRSSGNGGIDPANRATPDGGADDRGVGAAKARHAVRTALTTLARSIGIFVPVFFVATFATFLLRSLSGLNPARIQLGQSATPQEIHNLEQSYGLDRPFLAQYWSWLTGVLHGDLGRSWSNNVAVNLLIKDGLTVSLTVTALALGLGIVFGLGLGTLAAVRRTTWIDRTITGALAVVSVIPAFVIGIVLVEVFAVWLDILPSAGFIPFSQGLWPWLSHLLLPALSLSFLPTSNVARQLRSGLIAAYRENYVTGAIVRGLSPRRIFFRHVLRNGIGPAVAIIGVEFPTVLGGSVITESIFALAGFGQFANNSAQSGDVPAVQGVLVVSIVVVVVFNLIVNVILGRITPAAQRGV